MSNTNNPLGWLSRFRNFYLSTFLAWVAWVGFIDNNNILTMWSNYQKRVALEREKKYYEEKIREVKIEREEVLGSKELIEKWAREKYYMRKPGEDVYIIVDENNKPAETKIQ